MSICELNVVLPTKTNGFIAVVPHPSALRPSTNTRRWSPIRPMICKSAFKTSTSKLQILASPNADGIEHSPAIQEQMQEEKESIQRCLDICEHVSNHIATLQRNYTVHTSLHSDNYDRMLAASPSAVSAWLVAAKQMTSCENQLEASLQKLSDRLKQHGSGATLATNDDKDELLQEVQGLQRSLDICKNASKEADRNRTNVFEDISMADDGYQVIASTVGDLIFARKVKAGARSAQVFGQMSDVTIQQVASNRDAVTLKVSDQENMSHDDFKERFGIGQDLQSKTFKGATWVCQMRIERVYPWQALGEGTLDN